MKRFKILDLSRQNEGIRVFENEAPTLNARDYKQPRLVIEMNEYKSLFDKDEIPTIRTGGASLTKKHSWDMIKVKQINESKESNGAQPYMQNRVFDSDGLSPTIDSMSGRISIAVKSATKEGFEVAKEGDAINMSVPNSATRRGRVGNGQAQTLDTQSNQAVIVAQRGRGEDNKQQLEQRNDGNTNTLTGVSKDNMVKICKPCRTDEAKAVRRENFKNGKDYTPFQGKELRFKESEEMNTITCATQKDNLLAEGISIRRLTPIECCRLQGFPDTWTLYGNYNGTVKEISATQRYKLMGNAVTVDIVELIGRKLLNPPP